jgi:2-methylisocitrate lyase-like PEP mutase family enzyme
MEFELDEKYLALVTAFKALVAALVESKVIDTEMIEFHLTSAIGRLEGVGETGASSAMAEFVEPLLTDIRRLADRTAQPGGGT